MPLSKLCMETQVSPAHLASSLDVPVWGDAVSKHLLFLLNPHHSLSGFLSPQENMWIKYLLVLYKYMKDKRCLDSTIRESSFYSARIILAKSIWLLPILRFFLSAKMCVQMHVKRKLDTLHYLKRTDPSLCWFFLKSLKTNNLPFTTTTTTPRLSSRGSAMCLTNQSVVFWLPWRLQSSSCLDISSSAAFKMLSFCQGKFFTIINFFTTHCFFHFKRNI